MKKKNECLPVRQGSGAASQKAAQWVAFFIFISVFFTGLGLVSQPINETGFCRVYP